MYGHWKIRETYIFLQAWDFGAPNWTPIFSSNFCLKHHFNLVKSWWFATGIKWNSKWWAKTNGKIMKHKIDNKGKSNPVLLSHINLQQTLEIQQRSGWEIYICIMYIYSIILIHIHKYIYIYIHTYLDIYIYILQKYMDQFSYVTNLTCSAHGNRTPLHQSTFGRSRVPKGNQSWGER